METTIPISITIVGHPLIESVTVAWSANTGMVPQALSFPPEGGTAEAELTSENPAIARIHCQAQVNFALANWEVIHWDVSQSVQQGGDRIVIDPGQWIQSLNLQFEIESIETMDSVESVNRNHLVVNLNWQSPHLSRPVKLSHRLTPNQNWDVPYLLFPEEQTVFTITAFGVVNQRLVKMSAQSLEVMRSQKLPSTLILLAKDQELQLFDAMSV
ncbi:hypothetical protein NC981_07015 [Leptolyngbya sp. DQ-M1]|uniref:hypothetical protein n=1 Tax=Leptolyngbya sp. DQ-M1 TaxID=2933920 RepID=UPI00329A6FAC